LTSSNPRTSIKPYNRAQSDKRTSEEFPMHRRTTTFLIGLALAALSFGLLSAARAQTEPTTSYLLYLPLLRCPTCTATPTSGGYAAERLEVVRLVNAARASAGCPAARVNNNLMAATQGWSEYMDTSGDYRHAPASWYIEHGYLAGYLENIGGGETAHQIFSAWMESSAHKRNMLWCPEHNPSDPSYNPLKIYEIGVGHSNGYWTLGLGTTLP
jgi:uncharacterized protein YkwD